MRPLELQRCNESINSVHVRRARRATADAGMRRFALRSQAGPIPSGCPFLRVGARSRRNLPGPAAAARAAAARAAVRAVAAVAGDDRRLGRPERLHVARDLGRSAVAFHDLEVP